MKSEDTRHLDWTNCRRIFYEWTQIRVPQAL